ncbi:MAG: box helicase-like [Verrucomicrobiales bacterium]|nr:box helicase-like [Verrucomicrobiales bacterium]
MESTILTPEPAPAPVMELRPYQETLLADVNQCRRSGCRRLLVVAPTGSGKTVTFCRMTWRYYSRGKRVWLVVHRVELLQQISSCLKLWGVPHGLIAAGHRASPDALVQVCLVMSLSKRLKTLEAPDLLIIDESHHGVGKTYRDIFAHCPVALIIGFSATPERLDGQGLGDVFEEIVMGPTVPWLMENGFLSPCRYWAPPQRADYSGVSTSAGDYSAKEAETVMCAPDVTGDAVQHYLKLSPGLPAIAFCVSIRHAEMVAADFRASGVPASTIHSGLSPEDRAQVVKDLAEGRIFVLTSCDIVSEGFDLPTVTVGILLRKTQSLGLHLQQIGRVLRPHPAKAHSIIIDHVGNLLAHGCAEDEREWSLESQKRRKSTPSTAACVQCPECYAVFPRAPQCPECGHVRPAPEAKERVISDEALVELKPAARLGESELAAAVGRCTSRRELAALGKAQGYRPGWAFFRWRELCKLKQNQKSKLTSGPSHGATSGSSATPPASASAGNSLSDTGFQARKGLTCWDGQPSPSGLSTSAAA